MRAARHAAGHDIQTLLSGLPLDAGLLQVVVQVVDILTRTSRTAKRKPRPLFTGMLIMERRLGESILSEIVFC